MKNEPITLTNVEIQKILPHRYPFLLIDKIVDFEEGKSITGIKNVTANEPQFTGHFPGNPIMPGVLTYGEQKYPQALSATSIKRHMSISKPGVHAHWSAAIRMSMWMASI